MLSLVRCPADGGELESGAADAWLADGEVGCRSCASRYAVSGGILSLLSPSLLHEESAGEMRKRDEKAVLVSRRGEWTSRFSEATEVGPTLRALEPYDGAVVAEHGCGTGRYTMRLALRAAAVVAVDFSRASLELLQSKLTIESHIALVQADVTNTHLAPRAFHRVLSTLHSNLPTQELRHAALVQSARALRPDGRAVISMHHYGLRELVRGLPASGRYTDSGIYRYFVREHEARGDASRAFGRVSFRYLHAGVPGVPSVRLAEAAAALPFVRAAFAQLFVAVCESPLE